MKQLEALSIVAPGFYGLNTQESGVTLSPNFAQLTDNVIIDKYGRLGARKGWVMQTTSGSSVLAGDYIHCMAEHVNADDSLVILSAGNKKIFSGGIGTTLTDITPSLYTITEDAWNTATLLETTVFAQEGHEPLVYDSTATPVVKTMTDYTGLAQNYGTTFPHNIIAAWGRYWAFTKDAVYWSTDIADPNFPCFCGGTSGVLNIAAILPDNTDDIEAIAAHNNFLIIFCKHNIVIYNGADNPISNNFALQDVITGVGCISHKSVQNTGNDLLFLSDSGIQSLGRVIQEKSIPMRDLTKNVRDDFLKDVNAERANVGNLEKVVSVYSPANAFYLISFPSTRTVYCLDMRSPLQDGAARVTVWYDYLCYSFLRLRNQDILIGKQNGIGKYAGYTDNGETYRLRYFSHYVDFGTPTTIKILKKIGITILGGANQQFTIKVGSDYTDSHLSYPYIIQAGSIFEYGIDEYIEYNEFKGVLDYAVANTGELFFITSPAINETVLIRGINYISKWNGTSWVPVSNPVEGSAYRIIDDLYINEPIPQVWHKTATGWVNKSPETSSVNTYADLPTTPYLAQRVKVIDENKIYEWYGSTWNVVVSWKDEFTIVSYSEYAKGVVIDNIKSSIGGAGTTIQIGFEADVNGSELSVQKIDAFVKTGRMQ